MGPQSFKFISRYSIIAQRQLVQHRFGSGGKSDRNKAGVDDGGKGGSGKDSVKVDVVFGRVGAACCPEGELVGPTGNCSSGVVGDGIYGIDRVSGCNES